MSRCAHCGGGERDCSRRQPCIGRMTGLVHHALELVRMLGQCRHAASEARALPWCGLCGAARSRLSPKGEAPACFSAWQLPHGAVDAAELLGDLPPIEDDELERVAAVVPKELLQ